MKKDNIIFIRHILEEIIKIENSTKNLFKEDFRKDEDIQDATARRIEIIGEAAKNVSNEFKNKNRQIPWKNMTDTRNKLIHHYFGVDLNTVWDIIKKDLPKLKADIEEILKREKSKI